MHDLTSCSAEQKLQEEEEEEERVGPGGERRGRQTLVTDRSRGCFYSAHISPHV